MKYSKQLADYLGIKQVTAFGISNTELCNKLLALLPKDEGTVSMYLYPGLLTAATFHTISFVEPKVKKIEI